MRKVRGLLAAIMVLMMLVISGASLWAERLLDDEKALKQMLPNVDRIEKVTKVLTDDEITRIKSRIKVMVFHQEGSEAKVMEENREYTFHFGIKDNKKVGVVVFDTQPGKWGPVGFVLALDPETGKVKDMAVTFYVEKRGRPIALRSFLSQFFGKGGADKISVNEDIRAISGATISSRAAAFVVRKTVTLYEEVFLNAPETHSAEDIDLANRPKVIDELTKLPKDQKDKLLAQLVEKLADTTTSVCHRQSITFILNTYAQPEANMKLMSSKFPPNTTSLTENLAEALEKLADFARFKIVWINDNVKESAKLVRVGESVRIKDTDTIQPVLETVLTTYGCANCRKSGDKTVYSYILKGESIEISDLNTAQEYWQKWWLSYKEDKSKEARK